MSTPGIFLLPKIVGLFLLGALVMLSAIPVWLVTGFKGIERLADWYGDLIEAFGESLS